MQRFGRKHSSGLTLMELMVVVAIVAILATIGWSQYRDQLNRGIRGDAVTALTKAAAQMEQCYSQVVPNSYAACNLVNMGVGPCSDSHLKNGDTTIYSPKCEWHVSISQQSSTAYTLSADRSYEAANGSTQTDTLTLDNLGRKTGPWPQ